MNDETLINSTIVEIKNNDIRYQSYIILKDVNGKYYMITASNSRRFIVAAIDRSKDNFE